MATVERNDSFLTGLISGEGEQAGRYGRKVSCTPQRRLVLSIGIQKEENDNEIGTEEQKK